MDVKVLGTGCAKCKKLYAEAEKAVAASGVAASLLKVEKIDEIMKFSDEVYDKFWKRYGSGQNLLPMN